MSVATASLRNSSAKTQTANPSSGFSLLQRKCACGNHTMAGGECKECSEKKRLGLQTKLKVNEPGDIYEQEADRIADRVMAAPAHSSVSGTPARIQRFTGQPTGQTEAAPASVDQALASPGRPLEPAIRQDMEQRFGHDFSRVRVHSDAAAGQSARDVNAHAYTVGHNIVFGTGRYAPGTHQGRRLIAHELTHVMQQNTSISPALSIGQWDDRFELDADVAGGRAMRGIPASVKQITLMPAIQRQKGSIQERFLGAAATRVATSAVRRDRFRRLNSLSMGDLLNEFKNMDREVLSDLREHSEDAAAYNRPRLELAMDVVWYKKFQRAVLSRFRELLPYRMADVIPFYPDQQAAIKEFLAARPPKDKTPKTSRSKPGTNGKAANGRCFVVYKHEVRVGGKPCWRFNNPGNIGRGPAVKKDPYGVLHHVRGGSPCGARVGLYIFAGDVPGFRAIATEVDKAERAHRFICEFLLNYSHEGQRYLDAISDECTFLKNQMPTETECTKKASGRNLAGLDPDQLACISKAIAKVECGYQGSSYEDKKNTGTVFNCSDKGTPQEFRNMLGCP